MKYSYVVVVLCLCKKFFIQLKSIAKIYIESICYRVNVIVYGGIELKIGKWKREVAYAG